MSHSAGTAGDGYRVEAPEHTYQPDPRTDYGERPVCRCGRPRDQHRRDRGDICQAIPPVFTEHIGAQLLEQMEAAA